MRAPSLLTVVFIGGILSKSAMAQSAGSVEFGVGGVWHNKIKLHDGLRAFGAGARLGVWLPANFSIEGQLDWTRPEVWRTGARYRLLHWGGGLLYNVPFLEGPSGYVRLGYGSLRPRIPCRLRGRPCRSFGALNAGIGFRVPITGPLYFRAEGMYRTRSGYDYSGVAANVGIAVIATRTGGGPGAQLDDDMDGVPNSRDRCGNTARGALVDRRGCPTDSDGDGVSDGLDRCPGTPRGTAIDTFGCPLKKPGEN